MASEDPKGPVWLLLNGDLNEDWQLHTIKAMAMIVLWAPDPSESINSWFDEAVEADHDYLVWAQNTWLEIVNCPAFTCETIIREAEAILARRRAR